MRPANDGATHVEGGAMSDAADEAIETRAATEDDRADVLAFCAQTWDGGDYIDAVWDTWLADTTGALLVATHAGRPIGLAHLRMMSTDEAWIEGVRVDPRVRRQGVARTLISRTLATAHERGAAVARYFTDSDNIASQRLFDRFGFTRVAEIIRFAAEALAAEEREGDGISLVRATEQDAERIWAWLEQSNLAPFNGGLEIREWAAQALTASRLRAHLEAGRVWTLDELGGLAALAIVEQVEGEADTPDTPDDPSDLEIRYCDGSADALGRMGVALRALARTQDLPRVELWLPDLLILRDAMDGAGFRAGELMWVYAREL
jgi:ribosomal protein S18 acetylase RimI-like enzyme